jgi:hypothetical protein
VADLGGEAWMCGVDEIPEEVDRPAVPRARDLDPTNQGDAVSRGRRRGLVPAVGRVVVGERDDLEPGVARGDDDLGGRLGAVARRRVGMQVDAAQVDSPRVG